MAGIFPSTGVTAPNTQNAELNPEMKEGCEALYFPNACNPRFNPLVMNAVISEIVNAVNLNRDYDCSKLDNLATMLNSLKSLCNQQTVTEPDVNDFLAGCFDGVSGKVSISEILSLIPKICALPEAEPDTNDFIAMCVDGVDSRVPIMSVLALTPQEDDTIAGLFRDTNFIQPNGGLVPVPNLTWPRMLRVSVSRQHYSNGKPTYFRFNTTDTDNVENESITNGGGYQYYTFINSLGGIFRMEGMHLMRKAVDCNPDEEIFLTSETDETSFSSYTTCLASPVSA